MEIKIGQVWSTLRRFKSSGDPFGGTRVQSPGYPCSVSQSLPLVVQLLPSRAHASHLAAHPREPTQACQSPSRIHLTPWGQRPLPPSHLSPSSPSETTSRNKSSETDSTLQLHQGQRVPLQPTSRASLTASPKPLSSTPY